jgi:hypothetical protein
VEAREREMDKEERQLNNRKKERTETTNTNKKIEGRE